MSEPDWAAVFFRILSCERCDQRTCRKILRDCSDNLPQPGFIGPRFEERRVLLVGQNPGVSTSRQTSNDQKYHQALRRLRAEASSESWDELLRVLLAIIPTWPVNGNYFPLEEAELDLEQISYCNLVRCRTEKNSPPSVGMVQNCNEYFCTWLDLLKPRVVIFIGKWAHDWAARYVAERSIPCAFVNRRRVLSSVERLQNRKCVVALIKRYA